MLSPGQGLLRVEALALWHLVGHPPQDTHLDKTDSTFCAKFMIMNVPCKFETTAFQGQKENRTKEQSFNITSMKFFWQVRWIDQIQYPISLVASLDTVPVICCAPLLRLYCKMDKTFSASTRKINKWTCERPEVRAAPRNRFIYCQNIAKVMLVQVLLLLRSSTHTHRASGDVLV